jgi:NAD(P)-dependent dehydrogenase (short-subunit alcohol dehydrogenase family)
MKQVVLITGCSSGLGKFTAESLAGKGYLVYAGIRKPEDIRRLKPFWQENYRSLYPIKLDITVDADCKNAVKKIIDQRGRIDVLINNAGYTPVGPTDSFTSHEYLDVLNTNTVGAFRLIHVVLPQMKLQKSGRIINITSLNGLVALPNFGLYSSSKFALEALGLSLRYELAKDGIWVTNIEPGAIARRKNGNAKKFPHIPAREKFWLIRILMPMIRQEKVIQKIEQVLKSSAPPARVILGQDARITTFLQRFLPQRIWDFLLRMVWNK